MHITSTLNFKNAIGAVGQVYLIVGANRSSIGKVHIKIQGALRELEALTDADVNLKSTSVVKVKDITENGLLIVELLTK